MPEPLTAAEVRQHVQASNFSAAFCDNGELCLSWVQTRGKLQTGGGDSGKDLIVMKKGGFPRVLLRGEALVGGIVFSPSGRFFCFQLQKSLVWGTTNNFVVHTQSPWLTLSTGESFAGSPVWVGEDRVLLGISGGDSKKHRLVFSPPRENPNQEPTKRSDPIFTAEAGGMLVGWDHTPVPGETSVVVVHRLANAMEAEIVLLQKANETEGVYVPTVIAVDCRVEYSKPLAAFLATGKLLLRLNAALLGNGKHVHTAQELEDLSEGTPTTLQHGLWILQDLGTSGTLTEVDVLPAHGTYDVCSGSYGRLGTTEGFRLDSGRTKMVVTARSIGNGNHKKESPISYSDELYFLDFAHAQPLGSKVVTAGGDGDQKGCKIPVVVSDHGIVYHFRSPTESGDLYQTTLPGNNGEPPRRLTETMPWSLKHKLFAPREVVIPNANAPFRNEKAPPLAIHALLFAPPEEASPDQKLQPLLWVHGGPMCQYSYDCNPSLNWLASCGYLVLAPNFSGSTGNGLPFMNRVFGPGCGVADLSDCRACAEWLKTYAAEEPRLDLSRGIAVAGHSWGGYLALMCMLEEDPVFSCGVAAAGIADWFVQQRHTEVRYYDYALMGGWVYEEEIRARARAVSPLTRAKNLRAPLLVLHGDKDIDVPFAQIPPFVRAAQSSPHPNASVEYHAYPGEGHGMSGTPEVQADYLRRIQTFLRIHLKPWDFTSNPHGDLTAY